MANIFSIHDRVSPELRALGSTCPAFGVQDVDNWFEDQYKSGNISRDLYLEYKS